MLPQTVLQTVPWARRHWMIWLLPTMPIRLLPSAPNPQLMPYCLDTVPFSFCTFFLNIPPSPSSLWGKLIFFCKLITVSQLYFNLHFFTWNEIYFWNEASLTYSSFGCTTQWLDNYEANSYLFFRSQFSQMSPLPLSPNVSQEPLLPT